MVINLEVRVYKSHDMGHDGFNGVLIGAINEVAVQYIEECEVG